MNMNWSILSVVIVVVIGVFTVVSVVECRWYQSGLVFYDIATKQMILPPTVSIHRARNSLLPNMPIFSTLGKPCTCQGLKCGCCAGLEVREYNFNQKMCANVTYVPDQDEAMLDVFLNEESKARYGVSTRNPSPICVPIMMPIPMAACIQMSQVGLKGDNLHMCMDFVMRLHTTDAMELHFNCLSMGLDGIQYLDKNGVTVFPRLQETENENDEENEIDDEEYYDSTEESQETFASKEEESDDDRNNAIDRTDNDDEYYEDTDDLDNNEMENEIEDEEQNKNDEKSTAKDHNTDNLIIVYEAVDQ